MNLLRIRKTLRVHVSLTCGCWRWCGSGRGRGCGCWFYRFWCCYPHKSRDEVVSRMREFVHLLPHKFSPPFSHPQSPPSHPPSSSPSWAAAPTLAFSIFLYSSPLPLLLMTKHGLAPKYWFPPSSGFTQYIYMHYSELKYTAYRAGVTTPWQEGSLQYNQISDKKGASKYSCVLIPLSAELLLTYNYTWTDNPFF